jgi:hypothetical protein
MNFQERVRDLRSISVESLATWLAVASVAVFLVWGAIRLEAIVALMYQNADIASAPVLAELLGDQGSGYVTLGYYPWLETLYALHLTRWLPEHLALWKYVPFLVYFATVALVGWTVGRTVSRRSGLLVALAMAAPAPTVTYFLGASDQRLPALAHTVILAAFLVTSPRLATCSGAKRAVWAVLLAVILAPGVASDPLVAVAGVLPFLGAMALAWRMRMLRSDFAGLAAGACVAGAGAGWLLERLAEHERIIYFHNPYFNIAPGDLVLSNVGLLLEDVALFAHGRFARGVEQIDGFTTTRALVAVAAIIATVLFVAVIARSARRVVTDVNRPVGQRLLAVYWGISLVTVAAAFVIVNTPVGVNSVRYVTTLWPALLTLIVIIFGRRANTGLALLAAMSAIIGCAELSRGLYTDVSLPPPEPAEVAALEDFVAAHDLDHGYAGYWDAAPIMLQSDFRVRAYPIEDCDPAGNFLGLEGPERCEVKAHTIDSWYEPREGAKTFYVSGDPTLIPALLPPPPEWGRPFATETFGDLTAYAYDYDIASNIYPRRGEDAVPLPPPGQ